MKTRAISSEAPKEFGERSTIRPYSPDRTMEAHERAATKTCSKCKTGKDAKYFRHNLRICKACCCEIERQRYADPAYKAKHDAGTKKYYAQNRSGILKQKSEYEKRPEVAERDKKRRRERYATDTAFAARTKQRRDRYYSQKPEVFRARDAKRRAMEFRAMPAWADKAAIKSVYKEAAEKTKATGIKHEVDHRVPLDSRVVCGLHVENNLRVIPMLANRQKANKLVDEMI